MANTTLAQLRTRTREHADLVSSSFVTTSELDGFINASGGELWDILVARHEDYCTTPGYTTISISGSNYQHSLPQDCVKLAGVDYQDGSDWVSLRRFSLKERDRWRDTSWRYGTAERCYTQLGGFGNDGFLSLVPEDDCAGTYRFRYVKAWTPLTGTADFVSLPNGWEEYISVDAAIKCKQKEESDTSSLEMRKAALLQRITAAASNRDEVEQEFVMDPGFDLDLWWRR